MSNRDHDIALYTAIAGAILGVGLWLFGADMRTVGAPSEHALLADIGTYLLIGAAVIAGVATCLMRRSRGQRNG